MSCKYNFNCNKNWSTSLRETDFIWRFVPNIGNIRFYGRIKPNRVSTSLSGFGVERLLANAINKAYDGKRNVHIFSRLEKFELLEYNLWEIKSRYRKPRVKLLLRVHIWVSGDWRWFLGCYIAEWKKWKGIHRFHYIGKWKRIYLLNNEQLIKYCGVFWLYVMWTFYMDKWIWKYELILKEKFSFQLIFFCCKNNHI